MSKPGKIRVVVLGWIQDGDRVFVAEGYDSVKQQPFYRSLGGGIDFGETSEATLRREFQEELGADLTNIQHLACLENIFEFEGKPKHEIIQLYRCDFADPKFYQSEQFVYYEGDQRQKDALWVRGDRFKSGELLLVPEACLAYL